MTAASGDVATTGAGFTPRQVIFFAGVGSASFGSWGFDDGSNPNCIMQKSDENMAAPTNSIQLGNAGSVFQSATVTILGTDGFTLTWVKNGSPAAGTATIIAICFK